MYFMRFVKPKQYSRVIFRLWYDTFNEELTPIEVAKIKHHFKTLYPDGCTVHDIDTFIFYGYENIKSIIL